jgi:hypothetical protein
MHQGKPFMKSPIGNPARVLLKVEHPAIQVRTHCGYARCIDPHHQRVICETPRKYNDASRPTWRDWRIKLEGIDLSMFTEHDLAEIEDWVQQLNNGQETMKSIDEMEDMSEAMKTEIKRRVA